MARILTPTVLRPAALALLLYVTRGQEVATQAPANQTATTSQSTAEIPPAAPAPMTPANQTALAPAPPTTPTNQTTTGNQTAGGRPSAMSQLEVRTFRMIDLQMRLDSHIVFQTHMHTQVLLKGNHTWFDPSNLIHYEQSDYQIVNHSPDAICNVTLTVRLCAVLAIAGKGLVGSI
jgi:hypothetical protein